jgi:hypothetical protein
MGNAHCADILEEIADLLAIEETQELRISEVGGWRERTS